MMSMFCSCSAASKVLSAVPLKVGVIEAPTSRADWLHCYSGRHAAPGLPADNVASIDVLALAGGSALVIGCGYGDQLNGTAGNVRTAFDDAVMAHDAIVRMSMAASAPVAVWVPHWHYDHVNPEFLSALEGLGHAVLFIACHASDIANMTTLPGWTAAQKSLFFSLTGSPCAPAGMLLYLRDGGSIQPSSRPGHTPGSIDFKVVDAAGVAVALIQGSVNSARCPKPPGALVVPAHGNL